MKFRKKPVVIEAIQWTVSIDSEEQIKNMGCDFIIAGNPDYLLIKTLEGVMTASPWDWIIKGIKGEFYPCKPEIFLETYEQVS